MTSTYVRPRSILSPLALALLVALGLGAGSAGAEPIEPEPSVADADATETAGSGWAPFPGVITDFDAEPPSQEADETGRRPGEIAFDRALLGPDVVLAESDLSADKDAFVASAFPDNNYGGFERLNVGQLPGYGAVRSAVQFKMSDLGKERAVTGVELRMYMSASGSPGDPGRDIPLYRIRDSWDEYGVTWNNEPSVYSNRIATTRIGLGSGWQTWRSDDLTKLIQDWRRPQWQDKHKSNRGLGVQGYETDNSYRSFNSRHVGNGPRLRLTHVEDTLRPSSVLAPLPTYINAEDANDGGQTADIDLSWSYSDPAPSSFVERFKIYARVAGTTWGEIESAFQGTEYSYRAQNGKRMQFVTYAVDSAGNEEQTKPDFVETLVDLTSPWAKMNPLPAWSPPTFTISWDQSVDEPQGQGLTNSGIDHYDVWYSINQGGWAVAQLATKETSWVVSNAIEGARYDFRVRATDRAGNLQPVGVSPEANTRIDGKAPVTSMLAPPSYDQANFVVRWSADDGGGSGVQSYDVQYRVNQGAWRDWQMNTEATQETFTGQFSNTYGFRSRARDAVGNVGAWPAGAQITVGVLDPDTLTSEVFLPWVGK